MNDLAIQAKNDNYALEKIFSLMEPMCRGVASRYQTWFMEYDDLLNYAREDVWYAVKKFEPNGKSFVNYCQMMVVNHMRSRMKRAFGKMRQHDREAARLDVPHENEDSWHDAMPSPNSVEATVIHRERIGCILPTIRSGNLSQLEYDSVRLFWFDEMDYKSIGETLGVNYRAVDNALIRAKRKLRKNEQLQAIYAEIG